METTKEERDEMRRRRGRTPDHVRRRVLNDADRLSAIEREVRELATKLRGEARRNFGRGTEYHTDRGTLKQRIAAEVEAILDPPEGL